MIEKLDQVKQGLLPIATVKYENVYLTEHTFWYNGNNGRTSGLKWTVQLKKLNVRISFVKK